MSQKVKVVHIPYIFQKEVELLNSTFWEEQQITKKLNTIWLTWSTDNSTISISFHHFGCVNITTTSAAFWSINVLEILNRWTSFKRSWHIKNEKTRTDKQMLEVLTVPINNVKDFRLSIWSSLQPSSSWINSRICHVYKSHQHNTSRRIKAYQMYRIACKIKSIVDHSTTQDSSYANCPCSALVLA